jgi:protein involved in polysaccharide export with SLBB domain
MGLVLDSYYMEIRNCRKRPADLYAASAYLRFWSLSRFLHRSSLCLFIVALATFAHETSAAQTFPDQTGPSTSVDCSDPLMAASSQCTQQQQYTFNPQLLPQNPSAAPGEYTNSMQGVERNYTDLESLTRQGYTRAPGAPTTLAPEPLTEFQKFVASTAGQILPIFGEDLFRRVPSTFAPLEGTPVPSDYVIGPDDELRIRIWGQLNFAANVRVDRSGDIYLPQVGPVHVAGLPYSGLQEHLRSAIERVYHNFDLTVDIGQIRAIQVYIAGQARRPGVYTVSSLSTLVDALFASGGPSIEGSLRHIQLRRGTATITDFDLYDLLVRGDKSKDVKLLPGDVIFIPPVGPQVAAIGSVRVPGIYELKEQESLAELVADAGGVSAVAAEARVSIERIEGRQNRQALDISFDTSGLATPLDDGDLIRIFSIAPSYRDTVVLRGNIANPGRYAWHPGMRLSELIPDKESLITRDYWWKRTQLGFPAPEFEPGENFDRMRQPADNHAVPLNTPANTVPNATGGVQMPEGEAAPGSSDLEQGQRGQQQDLSGLAENPSASETGLGVGYSPLAASATAPSPLIPRPAQRNDVRILAPEIDWDYAVIDRQDRQTLKTTLLPFDLGKLVLQHDSSQDLELDPGDVVTIFSEADIRTPVAQQTKFVRLSGEFVHAGVYSAQPGETLRQLVMRAGGFTPNAYLYGSQFTRESTRAIQQAGINQYLQTLNLQIQRGNLSLLNSPVSSAQQVANGSAAQTSQRELLVQLSQIRASGRIVLQFRPDTSGINAIPDFKVENGDQFIVPPLPNSINVIGAVYNQNSFLYSSGRRVGTYLTMAGGPNSDADRKHEFIIRADGEIVSRSTRTSLWGDGFNDLRIYPGDTIVVPEKSLRPSALRSVIDWSQMFSQFALGAAALSVIQ